MDISYKPIESDFHDTLEVLALEKKKCEIIFSNEGGRVAVDGRIEGIYERSGMEFLRLQSGMEIRLDKLVQVDGTLAKPFA